MHDPFVVREDTISDRSLSSTQSRRWVEGIAPVSLGGLDYLKSAMRQWRARIALIVFLVLLTLFIGRTAQLQIIEGNTYRTAAETNRLRVLRIKAPRGIITDIRGTALTRNIPRFALVVNPLDIPSQPEARIQALKEISELSHVSLTDIATATTILRLPVAPLVIATNLTLPDVYPLLIAAQRLPGISLETISVREYTAGPAFSHVLGYLGKIDDTEKAYYLAQGYELNDVVGKTGIEAAFEQTLRGQDGKKHIEVDATGKSQATIALEDPTSGSNVTLAIDRELQAYAYEVMERALRGLHTKRASLIALDPATGEIRAYVSMPSFNNNLFTLRAYSALGKPAGGEELAALFSDPNQPLFNRPLAGTYPSGSTIKPAIAAIGLQNGIITKATALPSVGGLHVGEWFFPDWKAGGHGYTNVIKAIAESVNTFFYIIGGGYGNLPGLGIERLTAGLTKFGFGNATGIELTGESSGLVPTPEWKKEKRDEIWYIGDTYHLAIGQGDILVTPLQIARMTSYFASSGKWVRPHLVMQQETGNRKQSDGPQINSEHIGTVREGMRATVLSGSARALQALPVSSAGKTGTAQWSSTKSNHAWFTGWAPYENPELVITVLVEEGGEGSAVATPIAKEVLSWWFSHKN